MSFLCYLMLYYFEIVQKIQIPLITLCASSLYSLPTARFYFKSRKIPFLSINNKNLPCKNYLFLRRKNEQAQFVSFFHQVF